MNTRDEQVSHLSGRDELDPVEADHIRDARTGVITIYDDELDGYTDEVVTGWIRADKHGVIRRLDTR